MNDKSNIENTFPECYGKYDTILSRQRECNDCTEIRQCINKKQGITIPPLSIQCKCDAFSAAIASRDQEAEIVNRQANELRAALSKISDLEAHAKRVGTACLKHDLVGGWACPVCLQEAISEKVKAIDAIKDREAESRKLANECDRLQIALEAAIAAKEKAERERDISIKAFEDQRSVVEKENEINATLPTSKSTPKTPGEALRLIAAWFDHKYQDAGTGRDQMQVDCRRFADECDAAQSRVRELEDRAKRGPMHARLNATEQKLKTTQASVRVLEALLQGILDTLEQEWPQQKFWRDNSPEGKVFRDARAALGGGKP